MKVIVFGATGMVGQGVLRESLLAKDVDSVISVGRSPTGVRHAKLREVPLTDFTDLSPIEDDLKGADACFYCLGVSSVGMSEADYTRISYDFPLAAARTLKGLNPQLTFVYVSGAGTDRDGRQMWQRVKGRAEAEIIELLPNGYAFRPGLIIPTHGAAPRPRWAKVGYAVGAPLMRLFDRVAPKYSTSSDRLARAMLRAARGGFHTHIIQGEDLR
ncbi:NAD-dependent epimerase/dehydratase family protein [Actinoplanes sp. NPDC049265]|uniref:NAD-dependent epimerase/dehydratase family protein n=1 Tax=Actinoplanes sp. NPDC049265 TaxID=3363902 RepID=UPI0037201654